MRNEAFSCYHPVVNLAFFAAVLGITMLLHQPVFLAISLICSCCYLLYLNGGRAMARQTGYLLPILLSMAVMNPIFNHEGVTVLWYLPNDNPVTLEAICYGLAAAVMMGASIVWFQCCNCVFTTDKTIYLFGRVIPALSLLISMTLRFAPRFKSYMQEVLQVQRALHRPENQKQRLGQLLAAFSATVSWAMEQSIVAADSMKSRGYGTAARTAFSIYRFEKRDCLAMTVMTALLAGACLPQLTGKLAWAYYPYLSGTLVGVPQLIAYACFAGICLFPLIIDLEEDRRWNSLP